MAQILQTPPAPRIEVLRMKRELAEIIEEQERRDAEKLRKPPAWWMACKAHVALEWSRILVPREFL